MTTIRVLVDSVGEYNAGDIVKDAPEGLVEIARKGIRNAASGQLLAELIGDYELGSGDAVEQVLQLKAELDESKKREAELKTRLEESATRESELLEQIASYQADDELKELKAMAKELKIAGYTKMSVDELKEAIAASGSENNGEQNS